MILGATLALALSDFRARFSGARRHTWYDRPTMSGDETAFLLPVMEVFCKALILAESENAAEIGVDHLLAALESPAAVNGSTLHTSEPYLPAPHRDQPLSSQARAAIKAAGALTAFGFEHLTVDSLRTALLAVKRDPGALS